ncbi:MAG: N-acetylmuramoyl-L-alanine amidase [Bacteroidia bacterium]
MFRDDECGCPLPQHVSRQGWGCPDGNNPSCSSPVVTQVSHLVVHHSAGSNTSSNWANTVRAIWNYHTGSNGWCDIGYNWLIDPNGVVYEGRGGGDNILGAHFCGTNTGTMGVCLLGDYRVDTPSGPMMRSLERLLAWKGCKENIAVLDSGYHNASSRTLPFVTGHRLGCSTTCPGDEVYNRLPFVRVNTADSIGACPIVSGLDEDFPMEISAHPNPAIDEIFIHFSGKLDQIQLFNYAGQFVKNISPEKDEFRCWPLPPGMYILRCTQGQRQRSIPFLLP